ncbi:MAG TPA: hypothetical protein VLT47_12655 [Anaeromyxobacteraceae bacterium]|nr:hypothetical protein [Anaeromyxobacteraceae bacterium]
MDASKQEIYFIAFRMQVGAIRRELPMIGLCEPGRAVVLEALDLVEAQVREWAAEGMVTVPQLQESLGALMRLPDELRIVKEAGQDGHLSLEVLRAFGILPQREEAGGGGPIN